MWRWCFRTEMEGNEDAAEDLVEQALFLEVEGPHFMSVRFIYQASEFREEISQTLLESI